jgi:hypothetical protein
VPEILAEVKVLEQQSKQLKHELTKLCWYMRGGLSYEEAYYLGVEEREIIAKIVEENIETTKKTQLPFF